MEAEFQKGIIYPYSACGRQDTFIQIFYASELKKESFFFNHGHKQHINKGLIEKNWHGYF